MKTINFFAILVLLAHQNMRSHGVISTMQSTISPIPGIEMIVPVNMISDCAPYVQGGVTFNFPVNTFTEKPVTRITLEWSGYNATTMHSAYVTSGDQNSVTIRVNKDDAQGIAESASGEVIVNISVSGT